MRQRRRDGSAERALIKEIEERLRAPDPEAAEAAGELLTEIGCSAPAMALDALETRCPPDVLPAAGILRSLGDLAGVSPLVCAPALKARLLPKLMPLASSAQGEVRAWIAAAWPVRASDIAPEVVESVVVTIEVAIAINQL